MCCVDSVVGIVMFSPSLRVFSGQPVGQEPAQKSLSLEGSYLMGCCLLEFPFLGLAEWALGGTHSESWSLGWVTLVGEEGAALSEEASRGNKAGIAAAATAATTI